MYSSIKDYVKAYQSGNRDSLNHLITFTKPTSGDDATVRLQFRDKKLNSLLQSLSINNQHAPAADISSWFVESLYRIDNQGREVGLFNTYKMEDKNKRERSPSEVASYFEKTIKFYVQNQIERSSTFGGKIKKADGTYEYDVIGSTYMDEHGEEVSHMDTAAFSQWDEIQEVEDDYSEYIDSLGGEFGLDKILTEAQLQIWFSYKSGKTEDEIAAERRITQQVVNKSRTQSKRKIRTGYLDWKMMQQIVREKNNPHTIASGFLNQIDVIISCDPENTFDFYSFTRGYLLSNVSIADMADDYERAFSNKHDSRDSFYDVLMSQVKPSHYQLIANVLNDDSGVKLKRDKTRFVTGIIYGMNKIVADAERVVWEFSGGKVDEAIEQEKEERKKKEDKD